MDYAIIIAVGAAAITLFGGVLIMSGLSKMKKALTLGQEVLVSHEKRIKALETR